MMQFEKPDGPGDLVAGIAVALLITTILSLPIVGGVMGLLLDAPTWALAVAVAVIFVLTLAIAFSPEAADDETEEAPDNLRWKRVDRPTSVAGWAKRIVYIWLSWAGMCVVVSILLLDLVIGAGETVQAISRILLLPLAILVETYDLVEKEPSAPVKRESITTSPLQTTWTQED